MFCWASAVHCPRALLLQPPTSLPFLPSRRLIVNKPLGTDLQHLHERLDQLQGGGGGPPPGGALGGLGAGGPSALFGLGGPAASGAGGVLPSGSSSEQQGMAAAGAAGSGEDDDIPAESLQQVGRGAGQASEAAALTFDCCTASFAAVLTRPLWHHRCRWLTTWSGAAGLAWQGPPRPAPRSSSRCGSLHVAA